jgi:hypothetical protein
MTYQSGRQIEVAYKTEDTYGELPGATSAKVFRPNNGNLALAIEPIRSNENRRDGMMTRGRHGSRSVTGQYTGDLSVGSYDDLIEAVFRGTFSAALTIDESTSELSSATLAVAANTITASTGSWIDAGLRVGDVIRLTDGFDDDNKNRNIRVTGLTATVITTAETLTVEAGPISSYELVRPKKVIQGITNRSFTFEEREIDIDNSEVFKGVRIGQLQIQMQPNGMCILTFNLVGQDMEQKTGADSPYFTTPTETTSIGLTAVEAKIRLGSDDVLDVSSLSLTLNLNAAGNPVVGSNLTPDVFTNLASIEGSITALKADATRVTQYLDETELSLHLLFEENETGAADFCAFHVPNMTLASATKSDLGSDGARTQTFSLLVGKDLRGGAYDATMISFQTSAT